jgi:ABC-2 type transport system ATP-binding protein
MNALSVRGLTKTYRNGVQALQGVDLDVERGDFFALLGPNGAGKTTLIGIITSLVNKSGGTASVFGHDIDRELEAAKACIGIVPQEVNFNMFETPFTIVVNQAGFYGIPRLVARQRAEKYLKQLQLWDKRNSISRGLSGGMKRRLMIARALMHEPRLLVLDEPSAGVDIEIRRSMWEFLLEINARGTTIILTTHYLEEAETLCRTIAIISGGRIVERDRMSSLLRRLHVQTVVLNLRDALAAAPSLEGYTVTLVDDHTLEVEVSKEESLNDIFARLSALGIEVLSMRNKVNRLEEIFMQLVEGRGPGSEGSRGNGGTAAAGGAGDAEGAGATGAADSADTARATGTAVRR